VQLIGVERARPHAGAIRTPVRAHLSSLRDATPSAGADAPDESVIVLEHCM
jgi:hypothetical protein